MARFETASPRIFVERAAIRREQVLVTTVTDGTNVSTSEQLALIVETYC